jgi:hypothetical protein
VTLSVGKTVSSARSDSVVSAGGPNTVVG